MKKLLKIMLVAVFVAVAGYGVYTSQKINNIMSELILANVEALANDESNGGPVDPNKAYGYKLTNCYDKYGAAKGAYCASVMDQESSCSYSSAWGECN